MEFVDDLPAGVGAHVICSAEVDQVVESEFFAAERADGFDVLAFDGERGLASERFLGQDGKTLFDALDCGFRRR